MLSDRLENVTASRDQAVTVRLVRLIPCLMAAVLGVAPSTAHPAVQRALLSIVGLQIPPGRYLNGLRLETWGVDVLELCHLPPDWEMNMEKYENPGGLIRGNGAGHGALDQTRARELTSLVLVDVYDYQPKPRGDPKGEYHPPSFVGWVRVGASYPPAGRRIKLAAANFKLVAATACPQPPPAQP